MRVCHNVATADGINLRSKIDASFDLLIRIVRMQGTVEQPVNIISAAGTTYRATRQLQAQANKETKCPTKYFMSVVLGWSQDRNACV